MFAIIPLYIAGLTHVQQYLVSIAMFSICLLLAQQGLQAGPLSQPLLATLSPSVSQPNSFESCRVVMLIFILMHYGNNCIWHTVSTVLSLCVPCFLLAAFLQMAFHWKCSLPTENERREKKKKTHAQHQTSRCRRLLTVADDSRQTLT